MAYKMLGIIQQELGRRGWVRGAGGDLYFDGNGSSQHPHLHLKLEGAATVPIDGDNRAAVKMLAWSDGGQGRGGGGKTLISVQAPLQGTINRNHQNQAFMFAPVTRNTSNFKYVTEHAGTNQDIKEELAWVWTYFSGN